MPDVQVVETWKSEKPLGGEPLGDIVRTLVSEGFHAFQWKYGHGLAVELPRGGRVARYLVGEEELTLDVVSYEEEHLRFVDTVQEILREQGLNPA